MIKKLSERIGYIYNMGLLLLVYNGLCAQDNTAEKVYEKVNDAVVRIYSTDFSGETQSQGSGIILKGHKWLITNEHVLGSGNILYAEHHNKFFSLTRVLLKDDLHDVLVIEINDDSLAKFDTRVPSIKPGNSDNLRPGQRIYAIASPLGYENSISEGLISGIRKSGETDEDWIQFTAPVSPGSSGGGLFDTKGNLVGIIRLQTSGNAQNLNFAIPINRIFKLVEDQKKGVTTDYNYYVKTGLDYFKSNRLKQAHSAFMEANRLIPQDSAMLRRTIQYYSGWCDYNTGDFEGAVQHFLRSKFCDSLRTDSYYYLGVCYASLNDPYNAKYYFEKAIADDSLFLLAYTSYATMQMNLKKYNEAMDILKHAIDIDSKNYLVLKILARISYETGNYATAQESCYNILEFRPNDATVMMLLSKILIARGHTENAFRWQKKAYDINPQLRYQNSDK